MRRLWIGHVITVLVGAKQFLLAIRRPTDEVIEPITRDGRQVVISVKPSRVDRPKGVWPPSNRPMRIISTVSIDITPAGVKTTTNLQGLVDAIIKNDLRIGITGTAAFGLPLGRKNTHPQCGSTIVFVGSAIPVLKNLDRTANRVV